MNKLDVNSDMYRIVGCAFAVYNHLKPGYLESVYEKALEKELTAEGFAVRRQVKLPVYYKGELLDAPFVLCPFQVIRFWMWNLNLYI